jgi:predicted acylesterase/phospholipase RssA
MPTIRHLVLSGGGPVMVQTLAAIQELESSGFMKREDIESIYGVSAGCIVGVLFSLGFDWTTINDYIIKRPWQDVFKVRVQDILDSYTKRGIFDLKTIEKCFKPLLDAKDIPLDIHLKDFYALTKIDLHFFAFDVNRYELEDISHTTYPDLPLLEAIQMTCAIPVLMTPAILGEKCFMDGGVACNYPLRYCLERPGVQEDEVLGFKNQYSNAERKGTIDASSTLLDYLLNFLFKAIFSLNRNNVQPTIENEVVCDASYLSLDLFRSTLSDIEVRRSLFQQGKKEAQAFLQNRV